MLDEQFLSVKEANGCETKVFWNDLTEIKVETNDLGPFDDDLIFILVTKALEIHIPQSVKDIENLPVFLLEFPGFDYELYITAMSSAENNIFDVWKK